jgi:hypothetical protein
VTQQKDLSAEEHHRLDLMIECPDCKREVGKNCIIEGKVNRRLVHARRRLWRLLKAGEIFH